MRLASELADKGDAFIISSGKSGAGLSGVAVVMRKVELFAVHSGPFASRLAPGVASELEPFVAFSKGTVDEVGESLHFGYVL